MTSLADVQSNRFISLDLDVYLTDKVRLKRTLRKLRNRYSIDDTRVLLPQDFTLATGADYAVVLPTAPNAPNRMVIIQSNKKLVAAAKFSSQQNSEGPITMDVDGFMLLTTQLESLTISNPTIFGGDNSSATVSVITF